MQTTTILGESQPIKQALALATRVAPTDGSVLIQGASGTGKELFAKHIHGTSGRTGPFIPVNCAAIPEALFESLLFGHRRGAFTGATQAQTGLLVAADGGTLFLDEVADMPLPMQAKLLRVLQEREVRVVGEVRSRPTNFRLISATHNDLRQRVQTGTFRQDLFYRLAEITLLIPDLHARGRDVVLLARHYLRLQTTQRGMRATQLARGTDAVLLKHTWPGNVRELRNVLFQASLNATKGVITSDVLLAILELPTQPEPKPDDARVLQAVRSALVPVSISELMADLGLPRTNTKRLLIRHCMAGRLQRIGKGRSTRYTICSTVEA